MHIVPLNVIRPVRFGHQPPVPPTLDELKQRITQQLQNVGINTTDDPAVSSAEVLFYERPFGINPDASGVLVVESRNSTQLKQIVAQIKQMPGAKQIAKAGNNLYQGWLQGHPIEIR